MAQYDREFSAGQGHSSQEPLLDFEGSSPGADDDFLSDGHGGPRKLARTSSMVYARDSSNGFNPHSPHSPQHNQIRHHSHSGEISYVTMGGSDHVDASLSAVHFQTPAFHPHSPPAVAARQAEEFAANDEMAAALVGQLRIDDTGVGKTHASSIVGIL